MLGARAVIGFAEQVEFQFGSEICEVATLLQPLHLPPQDSTRRMRQIGVVVMVEHVAQNQRRLLQPRHMAQRGKVRLHDEVAIALRPACCLVAGHRLHIDVVGQQIVAAMRLVMRGFDEIPGQETLADETALHVDGTGENRVDLVARNRFLQLLE